MMAAAIAMGTRSVDQARDERPLPHIIGRPHFPLQEENAVTEQRARELEEKNRILEDLVSALRAEIRQLKGESTPNPIPERHQEDVLMATNGTYEEIKRRLMEEAPGIIKLLATKPEIEVTVQRQTVQMDGSSLKGRIARLIANGFYREGATQSRTRSELARTGPDVNSGNLSRALSDLVAQGFLTDEGRAGYKEVNGMKINIIDG